jgi:hypothetical protein
MRRSIQKCKIEPTAHLVQRMNERGFNALEIEDAVYRGSKRYLNRDKYIGRCRNCQVVVKIRRCHLTVITVEGSSYETKM